MFQYKLYEMRKQKQLTQQDVANHIGISVVSYGLKEAGKRQFKAEEMFSISKLFRKPVDYIFVSATSDIIESK